MVTSVCKVSAAKGQRCGKHVVDGGQRNSGLEANERVCVCCGIQIARLCC
jgi:hypothetical protein